jgi:hypothetical protein
LIANAFNLFQGLNGLSEIERPAAIPDPDYKITLRWRNIIAFIIMHTFTIISFFDLPKLWTTYFYQVNI